MRAEPRILTSRHRAVADFDLTGLRPGFTPVRISLGAPRFLPDSAAWPYIEELAPKGLLGIEDEGDFRSAYVARLNRIGVDRIEARFQSIIHDYPDQPLALLCFEDVTVEWCHRSIFSAWWQTQTGEVLEERNSPEELPVSGWLWTATGWQRHDTPEQPPVQLSRARRTA